MSKIDEIAEQFAEAVRKAFVKVYGKPGDPGHLQSVRPSWSADGVKQGWHDPDPGVVVVGTEYGWIQDPWSEHIDEHAKWERAMDHLRSAGWNDVNFESINAAVHIVYWMPPGEWRKILGERIKRRLQEGR